MTEHTRLPWHHSRKSVYVSDINHTCLAQMLRGQEVNEANAELIVKSVNNHDALVALLKAYEQWEADIILENKCWTGQNVQLTDALYERMIELQTERNRVLAAMEDQS